jgi:hypothetical protein
MDRKGKLMEFNEDDKYVHLMSVISPEYSLCGRAWDLADTDPEEIHDGILRKTNKKVVTCPYCIKEIKNCKRVKFK